MLLINFEKHHLFKEDNQLKRKTAQFSIFSLSVHLQPLNMITCTLPRVWRSYLYHIKNWHEQDSRDKVGKYLSYFQYENRIDYDKRIVLIQI